MKTKTIILFAILSQLTIACGRFSLESNEDQTSPRVVTKDFQSVKIATIGDSLTQAASSESFNSTSILNFVGSLDWKDIIIDAPQNSWVTGTELKNGGSHFQRLSQMTDKDIETFDASRTGAQAIGLFEGGDLNLGFGLKSDLENQARGVFENLNSADLNYVTIMIGANDVCNNHIFDRSIDEFKDLLKEKMKFAINLIGSKSDLILLSSIPNVKEVFSKPETCQWNDNVLTENLDVQGLVKDLTCGFADDANYDRFVDAANEVYAEIAQQSVYNVVYDDSFVNVSTQPEDVGYDCFHPSKSGQEKISNRLWNSVENFFKANLK